MVSLDLILDTVNITWINIVIQAVTTFAFYIIFLIAVHYFSAFNSYASIDVSVNSPVLWINIIFVNVLGFIFDFMTLIYKYNFGSNICRELKKVYHEYGPINSTEHLSKKIKNILKSCDENKENTNNGDLNDEMKIIPLKLDEKS